ncbi:thioesterase family protein [Conexibacter sp. S30A1]|uniref:acyl-CoA thioesterase n=1 Tax=Conexibacter sp. S30A1 TaxID=2937800 RepID=UPI00200D6DAA|nr:thioesterase family protein [Conexibacter sp. S30A1]
MSATAPQPDRTGRYQVALRWGDMDALGHLNQAVYHELLEEARIAMMQALATPAGGAFVLARVELNYRREIPLTYRHVEVTMEVLEVGRSSITAAQRIVRADGELAADGVSVLVAWDVQQRRSRPLSDSERAALEQFRAEQRPS